MAGHEKLTGLITSDASRTHYYLAVHIALQYDEIMLQQPLAPFRRSSITAAHVALLTRFIDDNIARHISLAELADLMGLSYAHFSRQFKVATKMPPMRYVLERRVAAAKIAMAGPAPLAEVALDAGFSSQSHFTTAFRLVTGMTPCKWRAINRFADCWCSSGEC